ncbi:unnamed protein product, partial [Heterosigma akashiwo]
MGGGRLLCQTMLLIVLFLHTCLSFTFDHHSPSIPKKTTTTTTKRSTAAAAVHTRMSAISDNDVDVLVIGSGIGGLSCAALLANYGDKVKVLESHYLPGGCAHGFERDGYRFDSGPSMWSGLSQKSTNPLRQAKRGGADDIEWITYDGWKMFTPDGEFRFSCNQKEWEATLERLGEPGVLDQWRRLFEESRPIQEASVAFPPLALRADPLAALSLGPYLLDFLKTALIADKLTGPYEKIYDNIVTDPFLRNWLNFLAFALSGLPADGTITAAMVYTLDDLCKPGAVLDYPRGGSAAIVEALAAALERRGGTLELRSHVEEILVEGGRGVGVRRGAEGSCKLVHTARSNVQLQGSRPFSPDRRPLTAQPLPPPPPPQGVEDLPDTASFMHLHLGIDAAGLGPGELEIHYTVVNAWEPVDAPMGVIIVSIPTVLDPSLAPPGKHVVHAYSAGNEPYADWEGLDRASEEYRRLK